MICHPRVGICLYDVDPALGTCGRHTSDYFTAPEPESGSDSPAHPRGTAPCAEESPLMHLACEGGYRMVRGAAN